MQYQDSTFTANNATTQVQNGSFELTQTDFLTMNGTVTFNALNISSGSIGFYNSATGAAISGSVIVPVAKTGSSDPAITVNNFQGTCTLSWPSTSGPQYQNRSPGDPITLTNFLG
jgi:hypothetical protein